MKNIRGRIVERMPSIGRGQILSAEDAPARIDAGIELELGPASGDSRPLRTWPEQVDPMHGRAGVSTSEPGGPPGLRSSATSLGTVHINMRLHPCTWLEGRWQEISGSLGHKRHVCTPSCTAIPFLS